MKPIKVMRHRAVAGGGGGSPLIIPAANLVAGLHMNGPNNSTTFTDVTGRTWTSVNGGKIITADSRFGGACGSFVNPTSGEGSGELGERITTPDAAALRFGNGPWSVAGWFKVQANALGFGAFYRKGQNTAGGLSLAITTSGITLRANTTTDTNVAVAISTTVWHYIAITYDGTKLYFFLDGVKVGEVTRSLNHTDTDIVVLGRAAGDSRYAYRGLMDDVVIVKGLCLWSANFTPPDSEFQVGP